MSMSLAGSALRNPSQWQQWDIYRGGHEIMADGSVVYQLVDSVKQEFLFGWAALTDAERDTLRWAVNQIGQAAGTLVTPDGSAYLVDRSPDQPEVQYVGIPTNGTTRWQVVLSLREA